MAIKRCPYCRSIIDEVDRYCNNCGTQLLFPEDEAIEENIPGERILDVEDQPPRAEFESVLPQEEPPPSPSKPPRDSGIFAREVQEPEEKLTNADLEIPKPRGTSSFEPAREGPRPFATRDLPEMDLEAPAPAPPSRTGKFEFKPEKPKPGGDFEAGFPTSAEEADDISRLMSSLEKRPLPKTPPPDLPPLDSGSLLEKDLPPLRFDEPKPPTSDELPPWAERVKDGVTPGFRPATSEDMSRELGDLSFGPGREPGFDAGDLSEFEAEGLTAEDRDLGRSPEVELRPRPRRRKRGLLAKLKARLYDVLFVALLWTASLWASAKVLGVPLFSLIFDTGPQVGIFFVVLIAGYFGLFYFFLGETLGDRLGSQAP